MQKLLKIKALEVLLGVDSILIIYAFIIYSIFYVFLILCISKNALLRIVKHEVSHMVFNASYHDHQEYI